VTRRGTVAAVIGGEPSVGRLARSGDHARAREWLGRSAVGTFQPLAHRAHEQVAPKSPSAREHEREGVFPQITQITPIHRKFVANCEKWPRTLDFCRKGLVLNNLHCESSLPVGSVAASG
jgi:hypothetical protein